MSSDEETDDAEYNPTVILCGQTMGYRFYTIPNPDGQKQAIQWVVHRGNGGDEDSHLDCLHERGPN